MVLLGADQGAGWVGESRSVGRQGGSVVGKVQDWGSSPTSHCCGRWAGTTLLRVGVLVSEMSVVRSWSSGLPVCWNLPFKIKVMLALADLVVRPEASMDHL